MSTRRDDHGRYLFDGTTSDRPRPEQREHAGPAEGKSNNHKGLKSEPLPSGDRRAVEHDGTLDTSDVSPLKARESTSHRGSGSSQYSPASYAPRRIPAGVSIFAPGGPLPTGGPTSATRSGRTPAAALQREHEAAEKRGKPSATHGHKREKPVARHHGGRSARPLPSELPSEAEPIRYTS